MTKVCAAVVIAVLSTAITAVAQSPPATAAGIAEQLRQLSLDPTAIYRVRDLRLSRGDIKIYLNEGILAFAAPVAGHSVAAVFSTQDVEAGDAEILVLPLQRSERASLARYTKTPNLDEHFNQAIFLFTDETYSELLRQIEQGMVRKEVTLADQITTHWNPTIRNVAGDLDVRIAGSLLDNHPPGRGFFYGIIGSPRLQPFDVMYEPTEREPIVIGQISSEAPGGPQFRVWASFAGHHAPAANSVQPATLSDFRIDSTIHSDLSMSSVTKFTAVPRESGSRVLELDISNRMKVTSASIDGRPAEVFQRESIRDSDEFHVGSFLVVADKPFVQGQALTVEIHHAGSVIEDTGHGVYFVSSRNAWFPHQLVDFANFDLTFHCPENLNVVSTGELLSDDVSGGVRTVHRRTIAPARFAGFNLGNFESVATTQDGYHIECFANRQLAARMRTPLATGEKAPSVDLEADLLPRLRTMSADVAGIVATYTQQWGPLPIHNLAVSPIPATFGQGFPGLVYLSTFSYLENRERPAVIREPMLDTFFSDILLPHEVAHQWWGNLVTASDYRSEWLMEAVANYASLQLLEKKRGHGALTQVMEYYAGELSALDPQGKPVESNGSLDLGYRLRDSANPDSWRVITYDKGSWILHLLHNRMGEQAFAAMLRKLLQEYSSKPLSNEDFRQTAMAFMPAGAQDRSLELFFDTWIYSTGIPTLRLAKPKKGTREWTLTQTGVESDFTVDVPIRITTPGKPAITQWVRTSSDGATFETPSSTSTAELPEHGEFLYR